MKVRIYNNELNPALWDNLTLKKEVRDSLLKIATDFYNEIELPAKIKDIIILGSSANYNWSKHSDIDLHIVINFKDISDDVELVDKLTKEIKYNWNFNHDIHIKKMNVEIYIQDVSKPNRSTGVYSILNNKWVSLPKKEDFDIDRELIQQKYSDFVKKIKHGIQSEDIEKLKQILKDIYDMRQAGLDKSGEFSTENIVFKILRSRNHLDSLKDTIVRLYDKLVSVDQ